MPNTFGFFGQCEIAVVTEDAVRKYNDKHTLEMRIGKGVWEAMQMATRKAITSIKGKEPEKLLAVGNPANREEFFAEVLSFLYFILAFFPYLPPV